MVLDGGAAAISVRETLLLRRLTAQGLTGPPARGPVEVARRLLAIQAQDARGARLAVRARTRGRHRGRYRPRAHARSARS